MMATLTFSVSPTSLAIGLVLQAALLFAGWLTWRRLREEKPGIALLEIIRALAGLAILITLCQPAWVRSAHPSRRPQVMVLADASPSMETQDVPAENGSISRQQWIENIQADRLWKSLASDFDVSWSPFGGEATGRTDLGAALASAEHTAKDLRAVVLLSDGDWNQGRNPAEVATRLGARGVSVFTSTVGEARRLPDLAITRLSSPSVGTVGEPMQISLAARNSLDRPITTQAVLRDASGVLMEKEITLPAGRESEHALTWKPKAAGKKSLTLTVPVEAGEAREDNNSASIAVDIREQKLRVLLVESWPRWEFRYLRNALERDPSVEVNTVLLHPEIGPAQGEGFLANFPATSAELAPYDVVFLGDVGLGQGELRTEDATNLRGLVEKQSSGLVFLAGPGGRYASLEDSPLEDLLPVVLDPARPEGQGSTTAFALALSAPGRASVLTLLAETPEESAQTWRSLPGFYWHAPVTRARAGGTVLAVHESANNEAGRLPLVVARPFGRGKTLFLATDGVWRWRRGVEDKYHYRFWGQVARWMAYQRKMGEGERMRLIHSPDPPQEGKAVFFTAHLLGRDNAPLQNAQAFLTTTAPDGTAERVPLEPEPGGWGVYTAGWKPAAHGAYRIIVEAPEAFLRQEVVLNVAAGVGERVGEPARPEVMEEIARDGGGQALPRGELARLADLIRALPTPSVALTRWEIWRHPVWVGLIVALLTAFWLLRKRLGLI